MKPAVVDEILRRLAQREKVVHLAQEFGVDPKTIRRQSARGATRVGTSHERRGSAAPSWRRMPNG